MDPPIPQTSTRSCRGHAALANLSPTATFALQSWACFQPTKHAAELVVLEYPASLVLPPLAHLPTHPSLGELLHPICLAQGKQPGLCSDTPGPQFLLCVSSHLAMPHLENAGDHSNFPALAGSQGGALHRYYFPLSQRNYGRGPLHPQTAQGLDG